MDRTHRISRPLGDMLPSLALMLWLLDKNIQLG